MADKFIIKPRKEDDDAYIVTTIRIRKDLQEAFYKLAEQSNRSRNELMSSALNYALEHLEFIDDEEEEQETPPATKTKKGPKTDSTDNK